MSVEGCGICGTDLHIMEGLSYHPEMPLALGHEPVGVVTEVGATLATNLCSATGWCRLCSWAAMSVNPAVPGMNASASEGLKSPDDAAPGGSRTGWFCKPANWYWSGANLSVPVAASLVDAGPTAHNAARVALTRSESPRCRAPRYRRGAGWVPRRELLRHHGAEYVVVEPNPERRGGRKSAATE